MYLRIRCCFRSNDSASLTSTSRTPWRRTQSATTSWSFPTAFWSSRNRSSCSTWKSFSRTSTEKWRELIRTVASSRTSASLPSPSSGTNRSSSTARSGSCLSTSSRWRCSESSFRQVKANVSMMPYLCLMWYNVNTYMPVTKILLKAQTHCFKCCYLIVKVLLIWSQLIIKRHPFKMSEWVNVILTFLHFSSLLLWALILCSVRVPQLRFEPG